MQHISGTICHSGGKAMHAACQKSFVWLQVNAASLSHAAMHAAVFTLAAAASVRGQPGSSGSILGLSNVGGGLVNLPASNANGCAAVSTVQTQAAMCIMNMAFQMW